MFNLSQGMCLDVLDYRDFYKKFSFVRNFVVFVC